jgi:hypothetical protein
MAFSHQRARQLFMILACVASADAVAKDVAGIFLGAFILCGGVVGVVSGVVSAFAGRLRFLRGALLAVVVSLIPWACLLWYWDFPFPEKTLIGNLPFMIFVLIGTVPMYLLAYAIAWLYASTRRQLPG